MTDATSVRSVRRVPVGAEVASGGVHFRLWAPAVRSVEVVSPEGLRVPLRHEADGYFSGVSDRFMDGSRYAFSLDGGDPKPDPASRFQPEGPASWSEIVDPDRFQWTDGRWAGVSAMGQVIYELHVGTFTPEGTLDAAARHLLYLRDLGITVVELMPLADFPGRFGWGYDGVALWAPSRLYGRPDDLRRFTDTAHGLGVGVILDVVYNHLGPDACFLDAFAPEYFSDRHATDWGRALNFDGPDSAPVREFFVENAVHWIREYHLDGLRLDATTMIFDDSPRHLLQEIAERVRSAAAPRSVYLVAENEAQDARLVRAPGDGGYGLDAVWNDDFHHAAVVALTGRNEAYYGDTLGSPQELVSAVRWGFLFQGQYYRWQQQQRRGTPSLDLPATCFVHFLENHDQVANSARGARLGALTSPGRLRALTALLLLSPATPMLFQGQEFGSTPPFVYFADLDPRLATAIAEGRHKFLAQFPSLATPAMRRALPQPIGIDAFMRCKLDFLERERHVAILALHRDLLGLRRSEPAFRQQRGDRVFGAVLGPEAFLLRFRHEDGDRLLLVNLGRDLLLAPVPEPLLAPPTPEGWAILWGSEDVAYGGTGLPEVERDDGWHVPGHAAVVLRPAGGAGA
ncbi:MAG TPA: malto-oligosyltrehalose trehalohydrolase [Candidatus Binatia bacterium]|nr:malto-oligosyltrehalose trehalohydrolase [Candidatus Binatia bacterium]